MPVTQYANAIILSPPFSISSNCHRNLLFLHLAFLIPSFYTVLTGPARPSTKERYIIFMEKISRFPISFKEHAYNLHGTGYVPCAISERWLQFNSTYDRALNLVFVDVMTTDSKDKPKKLCSLCLNLEDLKRELEKLTPQ